MIGIINNCRHLGIDGTTLKVASACNSVPSFKITSLMTSGQANIT